MKKIEKFTDYLIIGSFSLIISVGLIINTIIILKSGINNVDFSNTIITALFLIAYIVSEKVFKNQSFNIPAPFYYVAMIFAFFSLYLGSYLNFYELFGWWDVLLHFSSGILLGLTSIIIINFFIVTNFGKSKNSKEILFIVVMGVLTSLSIAVFWEFYEYGYDQITGGNMQRSIVLEDPNIIEPEQFEPYILETGRYVDPGLSDTMSDFALATVGALIAGSYGYWQLRNHLNNNNKSLDD